MNSKKGKDNKHSPMRNLAIAIILIPIVVVILIKNNNKPMRLKKLSAEKPRNIQLLHLITMIKLLQLKEKFLNFKNIVDLFQETSEFI